MNNNSVSKEINTDTKNNEEIEQDLSADNNLNSQDENENNDNNTRSSAGILVKNGNSIPRVENMKKKRQKPKLEKRIRSIIANNHLSSNTKTELILDAILMQKKLEGLEKSRKFERGNQQLLGGAAGKQKYKNSETSKPSTNHPIKTLKEKEKHAINIDHKHNNKNKNKSNNKSSNNNNNKNNSNQKPRTTTTRTKEEEEDEEEEEKEEEEDEEEEETKEEEEEGEK